MRTSRKMYCPYSSASRPLRRIHCLHFGRGPNSNFTGVFAVTHVPVPNENNNSVNDPNFGDAQVRVSDQGFNFRIRAQNLNGVEGPITFYGFLKNFRMIVENVGKIRRNDEGTSRKIWKFLKKFRRFLRNIVTF